MREIEKMKKIRVWILALFLPLIGLGWYGMNFSPSITLMILVAELVFLVAGFGISFVGHRYAKVVADSIMVISFVISLIGVYVYAFGDDYLDVFCIAALILGGISCLILQKLSGGSFVRFFGRLIVWSVSWLTVLCGLRSPALLPYGTGLLLIGTAMEMENNRRLKWFLCWLGMAGIVLFSVAPALFRI